MPARKKQRPKARRSRQPAFFGDLGKTLLLRHLAKELEPRAVRVSLPILLLPFQLPSLSESLP